MRLKDRRVLILSIENSDYRAFLSVIDGKICLTLKTSNYAILTGY